MDGCAREVFGMSRVLHCPACGEDDDLRGETTDEGIRIRCGSCGSSWLRDSIPTCATCGGSDIVMRPRTMTQFSRGTQLSVVGWQEVPVCVRCDAEALLKSTQAAGPLPAGYEPAALHARPARD
jgi:hypothetical protein